MKTIGAALLLLATPALAHHSFAMFDKDKVVTLQGTVKEFQWANPHIFIQLVAADPQTGKVGEWSLEGPSINGLMRNGWSRNTIKAGDKARIAIHPVKSGGAAGSIVDLTIIRQVQHTGGPAQPAAQ
jgi:hypothetical protein